MSLRHSEKVQEFQSCLPGGGWEVGAFIYQLLFSAGLVLPWNNHYAPLVFTERGPAALEAPVADGTGAFV